MGLTESELRAWLAEIGADLSGVLLSSDWEGYLPEPASRLKHRSILLFGAGGPEYLLRYQQHAEHHGEEEHWLADFAARQFSERFGDQDVRYLHPYQSGLAFPFQRAAIQAGLGVFGLNHVVLNPDWGPWFSMLGAVLLEEAIVPTGPTSFDPCAGCAAPCLRACPSGAVTAQGYDGALCVETKLTHSPCLHACPARHACVVRADLRPAMVRLESSRHRDDDATREMLRGFLSNRT